jgi:hypothetical protein
MGDWHVVADIPTKHREMGTDIYMPQTYRVGWFAVWFISLSLEAVLLAIHLP